MREREHPFAALSAEVGSAAVLAITPGPVVLGDVPDPLPAQRAVPCLARPAHQEVVGARLFIQKSKRNGDSFHQHAPNLIPTR